jgi:predicted aspartyl protease
MQHNLEYLKARSKDHRGACRLISKVQATETPLVWLLIDPSHLRGYGLTVDINGEKSKLMLDTGASGILINKKLAEKAGLTRLSDIDMGGFGDKGRQPGYVALANSLKVGDLEFQNCPVRVLDQRSVATEDGLIGSDVFSSFLVDLDFPNEKLHLRELPNRPNETAKVIALKTQEDDSEPGEEQPNEKAPDPQPAKTAPPRLGPQDRYIAPEMKSFTPIYRFGHMLLVPTTIGQTSPKLFVLDSGGFTNLISPAAASEVTKVHSDSHTIVKGVSGSVKNVYRADKAVIAFGHLRQENEDLVAFDLTKQSDAIGTEISGILGFTMLRLLDVKIDYRDGLVDFEYDPKRWGN